MLIDWFTVIAQAANFLILVWLLKRFLYRPILNAIDARERRIAAELADADAQKTEAQREREEFQNKNAEFDRQHTALINKITVEADSERQRLFAAAHTEAENLRIRQHNKLHDDYQNLREEIARRTRAEVMSIAGKTLTDLAEANLEAQIIAVFMRRLHELDAAEKDQLVLAQRTSADAVLVRSAFELSEQQRAEIVNAIREVFGMELQVQFEQSAALIGGIELVLQGRKIAWSVADYLAALDKNISDLMKTELVPK
ncbi:MAG: F0F1 ATP synthase subunit delta [Gallionellaceae bacterium]|jgi:F-type H+-transporting ATPase subunit b